MRLKQAVWTREYPSEDQWMVALDQVEDAGLVDKFNVRDTVMLKRLPLWSSTEVLHKRLPSMHAALKCGSCVRHYDLWNGQTLEMLLRILNLSVAKHVEAKRVHAYWNMSLADEQDTKTVCQKALELHPEDFVGPLRGRKAAPRASLDHNVFDLHTMRECLPHDCMSHGIVFHKVGILKVIKYLGEELNRRYGNVWIPNYVSYFV